MLYSNTYVEAKTRTFDGWTINQIALGEKGRGRKLLPITVPDDFKALKMGLHKDLSIGTTRSGKPKVVHKEDDSVFLLLTTEGGYTRRGNGRISVLGSCAENLEVIASGNGADGEAGRIGTWDVKLLKVKEPQKDVFLRVRRSGAGYGTSSEFCVVHNGVPFYGCYEELCSWADTVGVDLPPIPSSEGYWWDDWEVLE